MFRNIVAIERDGLDFRALTILFEVPDEKFDIEEAARKAATEYCLTENGRKIYDYNCSSFNWADIVIPVHCPICGHHLAGHGTFDHDSMVIEAYCPLCDNNYTFENSKDITGEEK